MSNTYINLLEECHSGTFFKVIQEQPKNKYSVSVNGYVVRDTFNRKDAFIHVQNLIDQVNGN